MRLPSWISQHLAGLRALLVLTVLTGVVYPLGVTAVAQLPGLRHQANGSLLTVSGASVGSAIIGQSFADQDGKPLARYFQSRPSAAGAGYDPTATGATNLGPQSVVDTLPDPSNPADTGKQSLLTQVCSRSVAIGQLEHVDGSRPYCAASGVGAVLGVFYQHGATGQVTRAVSLNEQCPATPFIANYQGVTVECANYGQQYANAVITAIRGNAPTVSVVPADAVTSSGSGLDPQISVAYAELQAPRVAQSRGVNVARVRDLIATYTTGRVLGFLGQPGVNVLELNIALDRRYPSHS